MKKQKNLKRCVTSKQLKLVIKKVPAKKSTRLYSFIGEFYKTFQEELIPVFHKLLQIKEKDGTLPNSFFEANVPDSKASQRHNKRKKQTKSL